MSSTIRNSAIVLVVGALLAAGCRAEQAPEAEPVAEQSQNAVAEAAAPPARIDPEPAAGGSQIVAREDIRMDGKPACALSVRYAGAQDQPVTWGGEPCASITADFVTLTELTRLGQAGKLDAEARADLARIPDGRALYVEGEFASALYLPNAAGFVREVPLAD